MSLQAHTNGRIATTEEFVQYEVADGVATIWLNRPEVKNAWDPEAMVRGSYAHEVLSHTYRRMHEETGERRVTHGNLAVAERILLEELRDRSTQFQLSPKQTRVRAATRRLEFDLLRFLMSRAGEVVGREEIMDEVWDPHWFGPTKTLDVHISWLRKKIEDDPSDPRYITTVRGVGFRFLDPAAVGDAGP